MNTRLNSFLLYTTLTALLIAEFSVAAPSGAAANAAGADDALEKRVADFVQNEMMMDRIPALSVAVVHKGKVLLAQSFGYANPETKAPATAGTVYEIGSMTKQFTAAAVMLLVEQRKLDLDDPIAKFVGDLPPEWSKITVRHLLTHTSGIAEFTKLPEFETRFKQGGLIPAAEVLKVVVTKPLGSQPGEKFSYCNTGFHLLGLVIEKAGGQGYGQFMASHVFRPLGMTSTRVSEGGAEPGLAQGFKE